MTFRSLVQNKLVLYFLLLPFFIPYSLKFIPSFVKVYDITSFWKLGAVIIIFILYLIRLQFSKSMLMIFGLNFIFVMSSFVNGLFEKNFYIDILPALAIPMLIDLAVGADIKKVLNVLFNILATLVIINFVFIILYPYGFPFATLYTQVRNPLYFLGQDNGIVYNLLALLGINYFLCKKNYGIFRVRLSYKEYSVMLTPRIIFFNLVSIITMIIVGSATGITLVILFIALVSINYISSRVYAIWLFVGVYFLFFIGVIVFGNSNSFIVNITDLLGRDAGFTGRSLLWSNAIELIKQSPFIGFGNNSDIIEIWGSFFSAHNQLLDIAIRGGLTAMFIFVCLHISAFRNIARVSNGVANVLFVTIFCFLIGGLMESGIRPTQYIFLILASYPRLYSDSSSY